MPLCRTALSVLMLSLFSLSSLNAQDLKGATLERAFKVDLKVAKDTKVDKTKLAEALKSLAHFSAYEVDAAKKGALSLQVFVTKASADTSTELRQVLTSGGLEVSKIDGPQVVEVLWVMTFTNGGG